MKNNILELIGNTPMINLRKINNNIYVKLESKNPTGSVKDRAVLGILEAMEKRNEIKPGDTIVEATSGNTGISLSLIGTVKNYNVIIVMPESMTKERRDLIKAYGGELILTDPSKGMQGAVDKANELLASNSSYKILNQFKNNDNYKYHYKTTGPEIFKSLPDIDIFVAGVGTGGTISGIAKFLKEKNPNIKIVAVEPENSPMISQHKAGPHKIQGIGANFIPDNYKSEFVDEVITVSDEEAFEMTRRMIKEEGISVGISSGANVAAAVKISEKNPGKKIATVSPDDLSKYISMGII